MTANHHSTYVEVTQGFHPHERALAAQLVWQAFCGKLGRTIWPKTRALDFIGTNVDPKFALDARDRDGNI